jgi:hypothetical protein
MASEIPKFHRLIEISSMKGPNNRKYSLIEVIMIGTLLSEPGTFPVNISGLGKLLN